MLEHVGFSVVAVGSLREFEYVLSRSAFDLAILGRTVSEPHKKLATAALRLKQPELAILEICDVSPCIPNPDHVLRSPDPEELAEMVKAILLRT